MTPNSQNEKIKFIVYSQTNEQTIAMNIGKPEYSYYFIAKFYRPILEQLGDVQIVYDPLCEVDKIYEACRAGGQPCVFLHFSAPQNFFSDIKCPTIHVFAWEYDSIPHEPWNSNGYNDWRTAFSRCVGAISLSEYTAEAVRKVMGDDYPVISIPCPVWDSLHSLRGAPEIANPQKSASIHFDGVLIDSRGMDLHIELPSQEELDEKKRRGDMNMILLQEKRARIQEIERQLLIQKAELVDEIKADLTDEIEREWVRRNADRLRTIRGRMSIIKRALREFLSMLRYALGGTLDMQKMDVLPSLFEGADRYATRVRVTIDEAEAENEILNVDDEAKSNPPPSDSVVSNALYLDGIVYSAIVNPYDPRKNWQDMVIAFCWAFCNVEDATLVIKLSASHVVEFSDELIFYLKRLAPLKCRVVAIHAYLEKQAYDRLLKGTTYFVNTSYGEGQSIPLCEAMSAGIAGLAPNHTAMRDYVFPDNAFLFKTNSELTHWQHDARRAYRCLRYKPDFSDLVAAYRKSYDLAKTDPDAYRQMGLRAIESLRAHCSIEPLTEKFRLFLNDNMQLFSDPRARNTALATRGA